MFWHLFCLAALLRHDSLLGRTEQTYSSARAPHGLFLWRPNAGKNSMAHRRSACAIAWLISAVLKFLPERESEVISRSQMARNPKPSLGNVVEHNLNLACLFNARQGAALSNPVVTKLLRKCFRYVGHIRLTT